MYRKAVLQLHLIAGLAVGLFVVFLGLSGCVIAYEQEIDALLNPRLFSIAQQAKQKPLSELAARVEESFPGQPIGFIVLPLRADRAHVFVLKGGRQVFVDGYTGAPHGSRPGPGLVDVIHQIHTGVIAGSIGSTFVGVEGLILVALVLSGTALWWKYKRLTVRRGGSSKRFYFDLHNAAGIVSAGFLLVLALTGVTMGFDNFTAPVIFRLTNTALPKPFTHAPVPVIGRGASLDQIVSRAESALPGARPRSVALRPGHFYRVSLKFPEDGTPGRSRVTLDGNANVLLTESTRTAGTGFRIFNAIREIHTGDIWGWPTKVLAVLSSLVLVLQAVSGYAIWWKRQPPARLRTYAPTNSKIEIPMSQL